MKSSSLPHLFIALSCQQIFFRSPILKDSEETLSACLFPDTSVQMVGVAKSFAPNGIADSETNNG
jgi:hypothetical protein